jgi:hypothetical protein
MFNTDQTQASLLSGGVSSASSMKGDNQQNSNINRIGNRQEPQFMVFQETKFVKMVVNKGDRKESKFSQPLSTS